MSNEIDNKTKAIIILSIVLFIVLQYGIFISTSHINARRYFDETNRIARETISDLRSNNSEIIQAVARLGNSSQEFRELADSYDELNRQREEELRRREELEIVSGELYTSIGTGLQNAFDIITAGQRELDSVRAEPVGTGEVAEGDRE